MCWPRRCRALKPGAPITAFAPKDKGGVAAEEGAGGLRLRGRRGRAQASPLLQRLRGRPTPIGLAAAMRGRRAAHRAVSGPVVAAGRVQLGPARSRQRAPAGGPCRRCTGEGADLGCGIGLLARAVLTSPKVTALACADIDGRAVGLRRAQSRRSARQGDLGGPAPAAGGRQRPRFRGDEPAVPRRRGGGPGAGRRLHRGGGGDAAQARRLLAGRQPAPALRGGARQRVSRACAVMAEGGGYKIFEARK